MAVCFLLFGAVFLFIYNPLFFILFHTFFFAFVLLNLYLISYLPYFVCLFQLLLIILMAN